MYKVILCVFVLTSTELLAQSNMDWITDKQRERQYEVDAEESAITVDINTPFEKTLAQPDLDVREVACEAEVSIWYSQMDDKVRVDTQVTNQQCSTSYGKYTVRVKTRDAAGETTTTNHVESWSLNKQSETKAAHIYDIKGDSELVSAKVHAKQKDFCTCRAKNPESEVVESQASPK